MNKEIRFIDIDTGEIYHRWENGKIVYASDKYYTTKEEVIEVKIEEFTDSIVTFVYVRLEEV